MQAKLFHQLSQTVSDLRFSAPKRMKTGASRVDITHQLEDGSVVPYSGIQTCRFSRVFVKDWDGKWVLSVAFDDHVEGIKMFRGYIEDFQEAVKGGIEKNSMELFKKKQSKEVIDAFFKSPIKPDPVYSDKLKCTLPMKGGCCDFDIYDQDGNLQTFETFIEKAPESEVVLVLDLDRIWFADVTFGVTPTVRCIIYFPAAEGRLVRPPILPVMDEETGVKGVEKRPAEPISRECPKRLHTDQGASDAPSATDAAQAQAFM